MPKNKKEKPVETKEENEEDLEALAEQEQGNVDDNQFQEFLIGGEMPVPVLSSDPVPELEETAQQAPTENTETQTSKEEREEDYLTVYNAPDYNETEMPQAKEMRERKIITSPQEMQMQATDITNLRPVKVEGWHEMHNINSQEKAYEVVRDAERIDEKDKDRLPFQKTKKDYKPVT